ncbi:MAG: alanyl-tRNA editing protein [Firmicutes bacterium]|nr:alanyl-tRNA editing protein [Bacillota bacterium]NLL87446.1 alanyl-tRNA editing protein [Bacillota bacterium]HKM18390.1 alanyl-tRNA editing protein [Limnochordia bacterium]
MQNRQYYLDPYQAEYRTEVTELGLADGHYQVILANTIFYPEGGGQPTDKGFINGIPVLHVYENSDQQVIHVLPEDPGFGRAVCVLDWQQRFYHMQHHTGQHLLSAVFYRKYGIQTMGFHLSEKYSTMDIETGALAKEQLMVAEQEVNHLIQQNLAVKSYFVPTTEAERMTLLRKPPQVDSDIRIVEIESFDAVPCCGTHVANTGEVGIVKVVKTERVRGMTRLYYRCGLEAFKDYQFKHDLVIGLANAFSNSEQDVLARVTAELEQKAELERELRRIKQQLLGYLAHELVAQAQGRLIVHHLDADQGLDAAPLLINEIFSRGRFLVLAAVGSRLFLSHNLEGGKLDLNDLVKKYGAEYGGRGGGKSDFAQVYFPSMGQLEAFIARITEESI